MSLKSDYLRMPLLHLSEEDVWTGADAFQGVQIFGASGSGKSTGSGRALALAMLNAGFGGLVVSAKGDELEDWLDYVRTRRREQDFVIFGLGSPEARAERAARVGTDEHRAEILRRTPVVDCFAFLDYCRSRAPKGVSMTLELVNIFMSALGGEGTDSGSAEPYWNDALRELLTHTIDLSDLALGRVDLHGMVRLVRTAPQTPDLIPTQMEATLKAGPGIHQEPHYCVRLLRLADQRIARDDPRRKDLEDTAYFWLQDFPALSPRTRSIIVSTFTSKVAGLLRSPLRQLLDSQGHVSSKADPEETHRGKIVFLDLPIKEFGGVGRLAQLIYKTVWQRSTEKRSLTGADWRPVFLWADESQYFVTNYDMLFQQTARSKCTATVYLTQNLPNYYAALGGAKYQAATESLLGNLQTKIFHANGDPVTNEFAERTFGRDRVPETTRSVHGDTTGSSRQKVELPNVRASEFTTLRQGGKAHGYLVDGFIFQGGRLWNASNAGPTGHLVSFHQKRGTLEFDGDSDE